MIIGQTLEGSYGAVREHFTPWFPRQADNAVFTYERIFSTFGSAEAVDVFHKNEEDAGTGTMLTGFSTDLASTGLLEARCSGLKEMVRFRVQIKNTDGWVHFRFLPPTWYFTGRV